MDESQSSNILHAKKGRANTKMPWKIVSNNNVMRLNENLDSAHIVADSEIICKRPRLLSSQFFAASWS
jgi:hypothetical protein